jgi:anti-anti-sigma factor
MKYVRSTKTIDPQTTIVVCEGEMDSLAVEELHQAVDPLLADSASHLIFDFAKVEYVSSSVLSFLLATQGKAQGKAGKVSLVGASELVKQSFEMAALDSLFEFRGTLEELGISTLAPASAKSKSRTGRKDKAALGKEERLGEEEEPSTSRREPQERTRDSVAPTSRRASAEVQKISPAPERRSWREYGAWIGIAAVASISLIVSLYFYLTR